jgi:integrase
MRKETMKTVQEITEWLRAVAAYQGDPVTRFALQLTALVLARPGELRTAAWPEIDLEAAEWSIPAEKMKTRQAHIVPLSTQAVAKLREIRVLTGGGQYVFPSAISQTQPMSDIAFQTAWRRTQSTPDAIGRCDFRTMARQILKEVLQVPPDLIDQQLAIADKDPAGLRNRRSTNLPERRAMMQRWADCLDGLRASSHAIKDSNCKEPT